MNLAVSEIIKTLSELHAEFHDQYLIAAGAKHAPEKERKQAIERVAALYVPKVLLYYPVILERINTQAEYIRHIEKERDAWEAKANKAYKAMKWRNNKFRDRAPNDHLLEEAINGADD